MIENPDITVILPCYNVANYVKDTVNSVLNQTLKNFEIIVIDDGSTDSTYQQLLAIQDKRLKIFHFPVNQGISVALNLGLKQAKGKYIASIAGDDRWVPNKLERQLSFLHENKLDIVGSWTIEETEDAYRNKNRTENKFEIKDDALSFFLTAANVGIGSTLLGKKEAAIETLDEKLQTNEDWEYFARLSLRKVKFGVLPESLTICTRRADGLSKVSSNCQQALLAIGKFKNTVSNRVLAKSYIRSALWMVNPENPKLDDAFTLLKTAVKTHLMIIFSRQFFNLIEILVVYKFHRWGIKKEKYS